MTEFNPKRKNEGEYLAVITSVKEECCEWTMGFTLREDFTAVYPVQFSLCQKNLWKLRQVLMACGIKVPRSRMQVDPAALIGTEIGICLEDDEDGSGTSVLTTFFPAAEYEGPDED